MKIAIILCHVWNMILFENLKLTQINYLKDQKIIKFEFESNSTIFFKVVKVENLRMTI